MSAELAWAAGFFDGEGSVFVNHISRVPHPDRPGNPGYPCVSVTMSVSQVEPQPLTRFAAAVSGRRPTGPYKTRHAKGRPYYRWDACGRPSVHRILLLLWPYLSDPKKAQARRAWNELLRLKKIKSPALPALPD